jgi:hypothetical protein
LNQEIYKTLLSAVECDTIGLGDLSSEFLTEEICLAGVCRRGTDLQFVPEEFLTLEICEVAYSSNNGAIDFIPMEFLDENELEFHIETNSVKILSEQDMVLKYGIEGLLTSNKVYLRELGKRVLK